MAGLLWIAAWLHLLAAHGATKVDERKLVFGLTWLDSGRLIAPSLSLTAVALWLLAAWYGQRLLRIAAVAASIGLALAFASSVLGFWTQPFGTYAGVSSETALAAVGGGLAVLGSVLIANRLLLRGGGTITSPAWLAFLLVVGALLTVPWLYQSIQGAVFGIGCVGDEFGSDAALIPAPPGMRICQSSNCATVRLGAINR